MLKSTMLAIAGVFIATQVSALPCASTNHVEYKLRALHGETLAYYGQLENSNVIQVFMNRKNQKWSILVEVPSRGLSCLIGTGQGYEKVAKSRYFRRVSMTPMS